MAKQFKADLSDRDRLIASLRQRVSEKDQEISVRLIDRMKII